MPVTAEKNPVEFDRQRRNMVDSQLRPNRITDEPILSAMAALPREIFIPAQNRSVAYMDEDIAVAPGRYLLEPMVLARMAQAAELVPGNKVLEIGCNTGYGVALLCLLGCETYGIDLDAGLLVAAQNNLRSLGLTAQLSAAPLAGGLSGHAPYDAILVHGAIAAEPPAAWGAQLAEGGRMLVVVAEGNQAVLIGKARLYLKRHGGVSYRELFDANVRFLPGFAPQPGFVF